MSRLLLLAVLLVSSCNAWQGTSGTRSSEWTWSCGGGDDSTRAPDAGCPMDDDDAGT